MQCIRYQRFHKLLLVVVSGIAFPFAVWAQTFGGLPPSIKWSQINTDTCRIIFPNHLSIQAQRVANMVHYMNRVGKEEVGDKAFKINILLNNQSTVPNGSVSIAPWKSHFLTTPLQNSFGLSAMPWLDLLAIHEYRHVIQLSTARRGFSNLLYYLFGQESWAGAASLAIPDWFTEGDAVWAETKLTPQGRGRTASFMKGYRALSFEHSLYNYGKARNRSIKDFVPDHYRLGYLMLDYGHRHYGSDFWKGVLADAASYKGIFYPFSRAMKQRSGMGTRQFYETAMKAYIEEWGSSKSEEETSFLVPQKTPKVFTNLTYPIGLDDGSVIYYETTFDKTGAFYHQDGTGSERKILLSKGRAIEAYHTFNKGILCWTEISPHPRWKENNYNDIITFDISRKQKTKITTKGKYFSPHINAEHTSIVAVRQDQSLLNTLCLIDPMTGHETTITNENRWIYTHPKWISSDEVIAAVRNEMGEMAMIKISTRSGTSEIIKPFSNVLLGAPAIDGEWMVFSASTETVENVFLLNLKTKESKQITFEINGAFNPYLTGDQLFYTVFTRKGHHVKKMTIDKTIDNQEKRAYELPFTRNILSEAPKKVYPIKTYRPLTHLVNLHTWGFFVEDPLISLRALSTNILNNVEASAGVDYNYDLARLSPFARVTIGTFYPQISFQANTFRREAILADTLRDWREVNISALASADLDFSSGLYLRSLVPVIGVTQTLASGDLDFSLTSALAQITFKQQRIQARKNLFTRSGQFLQLRLNESLDALQARQIQMRSAVALPAIGINHSLILHADYKSDLEDADFQYTSGLSQRGYGLVPGDKIWRLSANYHLPLFYPDWGFGGLFYVYRVRTNLFYEYTSSWLEQERIGRASTGVEFVFDLNLVNALSTTVGFRYAYPLDTSSGTGRFEFFVPVYRF